MTEFEAQVLSDLSALKTQMNALLGVGQPGRLHLLEERVERQERMVQRMKGIGGGLSLLITLFHVAMDLLRTR
jgi:predicted nicotinamide N-methyase